MKSRIGLTIAAVCVSACGAVGGSGGTVSDDAGSWELLERAPLSGRVGASVVWTGDSILVAGGWAFLCPPNADCAAPDEEPFADGAIYDAADRSWSPIADAPIGFHNASSVTVANTVFVLNRCEPSPSCPAADVLLAYDLDADTWTALPAPAQTEFHRLLAAGDDLVAFNDSDEGSAPPDYILEAGSETWAEIPDDPLPPVFDRQAEFVDGELFVFGSNIDGDDRDKLGAAFDTETESWRLLESAGAQGFQVWQAGPNLYLNPHFGNSDGGIYDPATDTWTNFPTPPAADSWNGDMAGIIADNQARFEYPDGWIYDTRNQEWIDLPQRPDATNTSDATVEPAGTSLVVFGGQSWENPSGTLLADTWVWTPDDAQLASNDGTE